MAPRETAFVLLLLGAPLTGCAAPGPYPSLAVRPAEEAFARGDEERQPTPIADDPELAARINALDAEARGGTEASSRLSGCSGAVGRPAAREATAGGAQQAVSRLETARRGRQRARRSRRVALARAGGGSAPPTGAAAPRHLGHRSAPAPGGADPQAAASSPGLSFRGASSTALNCDKNSEARAILRAPALSADA